MSFWRIDYFKLALLKEQQTQVKLWKLSRNYSFVRNIYINKGEGLDLNLHNNPTLVYCAFPGNFQRLTPHPQHPLFCLAEDNI